MKHRHERDWAARARLCSGAIALLSFAIGACNPGTAAGRTQLATPTAAAASPTPTATPDIPATYVVKSGDTGLEIAARFGITLASLAGANGVTEKQLDVLQIGQQLNIPR